MVLFFCAGEGDLRFLNPSQLLSNISLMRLALLQMSGLQIN